MHARTFLCREMLWQTFEEIAREERAPIDEVVSEAMRAYARQRSYGVRGGEPGEAEQAPDAHDYHAEDAPDLARTSAIVRQPTQRLTAPTGDSASVRRPMPAPPSQQGRAPASMGQLPPPPGRPMQRPFTQPLGHALPAPPPPRGARPMPGGPPSGMRAPMPPTRSVPPPPLPVDPMVPAYNTRGRAPAGLALTYNGRAVDVTKERFVLGRSKTQADLVLDDPNVSRQHAAIERVGDSWFLADLGSTNGCYIGGQRVSRRQIVDGDVIEITTHQIQCALR
jgi:hypothetical protein